MAQLQEVITEIHTKMEDYEFPIPTSHLRVELLTKIGKTDLKIKSGKLLMFSYQQSLELMFIVYPNYAQKLYIM